MGKRIAGIAYLKVDGRQYPLKGDFTVSPSRFTREGIAGQDRVHGFKELPRVPFIEGAISTTDEVSTETLDGITDATVTAELANGKVYVLTKAWTVSGFEIDTAEGQFPVRFEGETCEEI
jgi:hypothetical protein